MMKVQISVDDELMKRVDTFADENYMSRSTLFTIAVTQYVNQQDVTKAIKDMAVAMQKIADTGKVDHEVMEELEDFKRLAKMLSVN